MNSFYGAWVMKKNNIIFTCVMVLIAFVFASVYTVYEKSRNISVSSFPGQDITVVIDAGHGGVDGGATGVDGTVEKNINLSIAKKLKAQLNIMGIKTVMTRTTDTTTADSGKKTIKQTKTSDLQNRMKLVNETKNSVLISIHQNHYPEEKYSGMQVFYSPNNQASENLAQLIQSATKDYIQPQNDRPIKKAESNLYLLYSAKAPSVLVECGFMSNAQENKLLEDEEYQKKLAFCIAVSVNQYINQNKLMS